MKAKAQEKKTWMVEQRWSLGASVVPIRSVVKAVGRKAAQSGAAEAIRRALLVLLQSNTIPSHMHAVGEPVVLYAMGPGDLVRDA
jgi:hypothetical protein